MKSSQLIISLFSVVMTMSLAGCSGFGHRMKAMLNDPTAAQGDGTSPLAIPKKFTDNEQILPEQQRQYRRMTRHTLERQSKIHAQAGSLWQMTGQGGYLFAENTLRMVGDIINVDLEGAPKKQLTTKVDVIKKLLSKIRERRRLDSVQRRQPASSSSSPQSTTPGNNNSAGSTAQGNTDSGKAGEDEFEVERVPSQIVETLPNGDYRLKGSQAFMIGPQEYKVIVTGIAKADDFDEDSILSSRLMDPKFDIVSKRGPVSQ